MVLLFIFKQIPYIYIFRLVKIQATEGFEWKIEFVRVCFSRRRVFFFFILSRENERTKDSRENREGFFKETRGRFRVGVIMCVEPLFPTELNIASVIRWPVHTCLVKQSDHIWSLFPAGRGIFCNMIYFRANESQRFTRITSRNKSTIDRSRSHRFQSRSIEN